MLTIVRVAGSEIKKILVLKQLKKELIGDQPQMTLLLFKKNWCWYVTSWKLVGEGQGDGGVDYVRV